MEENEIIETEETKENNNESSKDIESALRSFIKTTFAAVGVVTVMAWGYDKIDDVYFKLKPRMEIEMKEPIVTEEIVIEEEPKEEVDISTWTTYDQNTSYLKVNVDNMYTNFIAKDVEQSYAIDRQKDEIGLYLGEDIYTKEIGEDNVILTNLNGREIEASSKFGICNDKCGIKYMRDDGYEISIIGQEDDDYDYDYIKRYDRDNFDSYSETIFYDDSIQKSINIDRDDNYIALYVTDFINYRISIWSTSGRVTFNVKEEEYNEMLQTVASYKRGRDVREFFKEYRYLLDRYFDEIKKENPDLYLEMINTVDQISSEKESGPLEEPKKLKYNIGEYYEIQENK